MRKVFYIFILLFISNLLLAQSTDFNKLIKQKLIEADEYYIYENYHIALPIYKELYELDSTNIEVNFKLGVCSFFVQRNKLNLINYFEKAKNEYVDSYFYLGRIFHLKMCFDKAIDNYLFYKNSSLMKKYSNKEIDYYTELSLFAKQMIKHPVTTKFKDIGNIINTPASEYVPLITSKESIMMFTSRRKGSTGGKLDPNNEFFEDIYITKYENDNWSKPENIGFPVNSNTHDACVSLSFDGKKMLLYRTNTALTGGDIYETFFINNQWTIPKKLDTEINSSNGLETSAAYTPDANTIYFSSNRPGGHGGKDIYRITRMPDSTWSKAQNLGSIVNTPYDDDAPFIHPDGKTMYFSSKGHQCIGAYDIFKSEKSAHGWSAPINIGYPLNTVYDDIYFVVSEDKTHGYFSSNRNNGNMDIFIAELFDKKSNYVIFKGTITTNDPKYMKLPAVITVLDYQTKELQGIYNTNKKTGKYTMVLYPGKRYKIFVESEGYASFVDEIDMREKLRMKDLFKNISLRKYKIIEPEKNDTINE